MKKKVLVIVQIILVSSLLGIAGMLLVFLLHQAPATRQQQHALPSHTKEPSSSTKRIRPHNEATSTRVYHSYDDFSNPQTSILDAHETEAIRYAFEHGTYSIEVKSPGLMAWSLYHMPCDDVTIEVEAQPTLPDKPVAVGIIFHYQNDANFYLFHVANNGFYNLELIEGGQTIPLIYWTPFETSADNANISSAMASYTLKVQTQDSFITLFVNGRKLETTTDNTFSYGKIGVAVNTFEENCTDVLPCTSTKVYFDNLRVFCLRE